MSMTFFTQLIIRNFIHLSEPSMRFDKRQAAAQGIIQSLRQFPLLKLMPYLPCISFFLVII